MSENFDEDKIREMMNIKKYNYEKTFKSTNSIDNLIDMMKKQKNTLEQQLKKIEDTR